MASGLARINIAALYGYPQYRHLAETMPATFGTEQPAVPVPQADGARPGYFEPSSVTPGYVPPPVAAGPGPKSPDDWPEPPSGPAMNYANPRPRREPGQGGRDPLPDGLAGARPRAPATEPGPSPLPSPMSGSGSAVIPEPTMGQRLARALMLAGSPEAPAAAEATTAPRGASLHFTPDGRPIALPPGPDSPPRYSFGGGYIGNSLDGIRRMTEYFTPSPTAVASLLPGAGFVAAHEDGMNAARHFQAGNYGLGALSLAQGTLNAGLEIVPGLAALPAIRTVPQAPAAGLARLEVPTARATVAATSGPRLPPAVRQRAFSEDYTPQRMREIYGDQPLPAEGTRLTHTMDGRPFPPLVEGDAAAGPIVVGRQSVGGENVAATPAQIQYLQEQLTGPVAVLSRDEWFTPLHRGYSAERASRERMAEAFRAYLEDPNYIKEVAPDLARRLREHVNEHPVLERLIQLNSLDVPVHG